MKFKLADVQQTKLEENCSILDKTIQEIIDPYCKDLDKYVSFIRGILQNGENPPTNAELEDCCINLSTLIYFTSGACETLGIRDDISKATYKEAYHATRSSLESGTVADKDSIAELNSQSEALLNMCYNRAYKMLKAKVEAAQELLSSCKKVLSHRMLQIELTRMEAT